MVRPTREQSRQRTRERLPAAAAELFTERGVTGTSVEQVAERAGFTRGAFHGNFADRDALVAELLRLRSERELAEVQALASGSYEQVRDATVAWHRERTELWLHALRNPAILPAAERERFARGAPADAIAREPAARGVKPPADPAFLGLIVHALEDGLMIQRLVCPEGTRAPYFDSPGKGVHGCCATSRRSATSHRCARAGRYPASWRPTTSVPTS